MSAPASVLRRAAIVALLCLLGASAPAGAHGIGGLVPDLPRAGAGVHMAAKALRVMAARAASAPSDHLHGAALDYQGGPVLHSNRTHLIFWQPSGSGMTFDAGYEALIQRFLQQVAADSHKPTNVYALSGQYADGSGPATYASSYGGAVVATDPLPLSQCVEPPTGPPGWLSCLTDAQLQQEIEQVVAADGLPRADNDVYFLLLPNGLGNCIDSSSTSCALGGGANGYCGYHSQTGSGLLYAVIPYNAVSGHCQSSNPRPNGSTADPTISTISHEHNEVVTDPQTYNSWIDANGDENGDLCITNFGPTLGGSGNGSWNEVIGGGHYYLQEEWSNEDDSCQPRDEADPVSISPTARVRAGKPLSLTGHGSDPDGRIVSWSWSFGDGGTSHRQSTKHTYRRAGTYRVVLKLTDSAGLWTTATRTVKVLPAAAREPRRRHATRSPTGTPTTRARG